MVFFKYNIPGLVKKHPLKTIASVYASLTVKFNVLPKLGKSPYNSLSIFGNFGQKIAWRMQKTAFQSI